MPSRFETRFIQRALPVLQREFNRTVVLIKTDGEEVSFECFLDVDEMNSGEGFSDVQGRLGISSRQFTSRMQTTEIGLWTRARIRGQIWDVYGKEPDQYGTVIFNIRRKHSEQDHTNLYDLSGDQTVWQERND